MLDPEDPTEDNHMSAIARFPSASACTRAAEADLPLAELGPDIVFGVASTEVETAVWSRMQEAQAAKRLRQEKEDAPPAQVTVVPGCLLHVTGLTAELNDIPILKRVFSEVKGVRCVLLLPPSRHPISPPPPSIHGRTRGQQLVACLHEDCNGAVSGLI
jgi:hypothetical protein